ncbi:MAG: MoaD/ThiS family protein [Chloroflexota bacterium]
MATVILPRSLVALVAGSERRAEVDGETVAAVLTGLDTRWPGLLDRLCEPGPVIREHINVFVDGQPADIGTAVGSASTVHVIPAISGG